MLPLERAAEAMALVGCGQASGKAILAIDSDETSPSPGYERHW